MKPTIGGKVGRPQYETTNTAMREIFKYIEASDDCQFTLAELKSIGKNSTIDKRTIKKQLMLRYGDNVIITEKAGSSSFVCFIDSHHDILNKAWYEKRKADEKEERFRILEAAAAIIREDIQCTVLENSNYPPPSRMFEDTNTDIPKSLTFFLEKVI